MARISDTIVQGLMRPTWGFSDLAEPLGMLMGGARAEREKQQRLAQAVQTGIDTTDRQGLTEALKGVSTLEEARLLTQGFEKGQQQRIIEEERAARLKEQQDATLLRAATTSATSQGYLANSQKELGEVLSKLKTPEEQKAAITAYKESRGWAEQDRKAASDALAARAILGASQGQPLPAGFVPSTPEQAEAIVKAGKPETITTPTGSVLKMYPNGRVETISTPTGRQDPIKSGDIENLVKSGYTRESALAWAQSGGNDWTLLETDPNAGKKEQGALPTYLGKEMLKATESARVSSTKELQASMALRELEQEEVPAGAVARTETEFDRVFGTQGQVGYARLQVQQLILSDILSKLPPGAASDADVQFAINNTIDPYSDPEVLKRYLRGVQKIYRAEADYNQRYSSFITTNSDKVGMFPMIEEVRSGNQRMVDYGIGGTPELQQVSRMLPERLKNNRQRGIPDEISFRTFGEYFKRPPEDFMWIASYLNAQEQLNAQGLTNYAQ